MALGRIGQRTDFALKLAVPALKKGPEFVTAQLQLWEERTVKEVRPAPNPANPIRVQVRFFILPGQGRTQT